MLARPLNFLTAIKLKITFVVYLKILKNIFDRLGLMTGPSRTSTSLQVDSDLY